MANSSQGLKNLAFPSPKYYENKKVNMDENMQHDDPILFTRCCV